MSLNHEASIPVLFIYQCNCKFDASFHISHALTLPTQSDSKILTESVEYELVGRVVYHAQHFTTEILLKQDGKICTFKYDDMKSPMKMWEQFELIGDENRIDLPYLGRDNNRSCNILGLSMNIRGLNSSI